MQFIGIGPLEFLLIVVIAVIVLGPQGMVKSAREMGKLIRKVIRSPLWREVMDTSREIRDLPNKIAREAGIEEDLEELRRTTRDSLNGIDRSIYPEYLSQEGPVLNQEKKDVRASNDDEGQA